MSASASEATSSSSSSVPRKLSDSSGSGSSMFCKPSAVLIGSLVLSLSFLPILRGRRS
ncbi:hypothetical protein BDV27DRAFT_135032 [Aspergillus caelatus]|uniref:Uncharacterized protein n=1 Tax=Aspergillus caelatus TaxID=61420 RepID=A0A5N6ZT69_9EURO|nr:uncharacterized protein BDV27DRAFT_135032 [Aspergillus caelatus]KAE8360126.1 hypothetical protein BDV27DRAFT_135032 [Aspergillus caelatus]